MRFDTIVRFSIGSTSRFLDFLSDPSAISDFPSNPPVLSDFLSFPPAILDFLSNPPVNFRIFCRMGAI